MLIGGIPYSGKLLRIGEKYDFHRENVRRMLAFTVPKDVMPPNFTEKTFANSHKTAKFTKVFPLESFQLYGILSTNMQDQSKFTLQ